MQIGTLTRTTTNAVSTSSKASVGNRRNRLLVLVLAVGLCCGFTSPSWGQENPELAKMQQFIELMDGYYEIIEAVQAISADPDKAAILQLQKIEEIYKNRGDRAEAIKVMKDVLARAKSQSVRNATSVMLADALNETGKASEAIAVLKKALDANLR